MTNIIIIIILLIASIKDIKKREVDNIFMIIFILYTILNIKIKLTNIIGFILCPIPLILTNLKHKNCFGGADIKIFFCIGLYEGITKGFIILALTLTMILIIKKIQNIKSVPMFPYILISFIIVHYII